MEEWTRFQEAPMWGVLAKAVWWVCESAAQRLYVLSKADPDTEQFAIIISDLRSVWMCEGDAAAIHAQHQAHNKGLESDNRGIAAHIDRLIAAFDPAASYEFLNGVWKVSTLLGGVYRFQCVFACTQVSDTVAQAILHRYLLGALFTIIQTQEAVIDRQQALIRALDGKARTEQEGDIRRLAQENSRLRPALSRVGREVLAEVLSSDVKAAEARVQARELEFKRKRTEEAQKQAENIKKPKINPLPAANYNETEEEVLRRLELAQKLQKPEVKKKGKKLDFL